MIMFAALANPFIRYSQQAPLEENAKQLLKQFDCYANI
jgi:hypothetical protein